MEFTSIPKTPKPATSRDSVSSEPSNGDLPLANLKRKPDPSTSSNTKKIKISHVNAKVSNQYLCTICGRSFNCHQALGGHKVHHYKTVSAIDADAMVRDPKEHKCRFCSKLFSTGQALGGHRRYCREPAHVQEAHRNEEIEERNPNRGLNLDLNKSPEEMDDTMGHM